MNYAKALCQELIVSGTILNYSIYDKLGVTSEFGIQDLDEKDITFGQVLKSQIQL